MRKLVYHVASTLDGFIARDDHRFDCFAMEGDHVAEYVQSLRSDYDAVVMGRRTYDVGRRLGVSDPYPWLDTYVVSRSLRERPDPRVTLIGDGAQEAVAALKERPGRDVYLAGGGDLAAQLLAAGLVDEVVVKVSPVLLGRGIAVAPVQRDVRLELRAAKVHRSSVVVLRYEVVR